MSSRPVSNPEGHHWQRLVAATLATCLALLPGLASAADGRADADRQVPAGRSNVDSARLERIKRLLETPAGMLVDQLHGLSRPYLAVPLRETHPGTPQASYSQGQGGGNPSHGDGWLALAVTGTVIGLTGVVVGSYGDSDTCRSKNSPYFSGGKLVNVCDSYSTAGVGLAIAGLSAVVIGFVGAIASSSHRSATNRPTSPVANGGSDPTSQPTFVGDGRSRNAAAFDEARQAIDEIRSQNPGTLPPAQVTGSNRNGATTLEVKNDTEYTLHVFLTGPQSAVLDLLPGYRQTLTILSGQYEIAARVDAFNVTPFYGEQPFAGSTAYKESFYIGKR